MKKMQIGNIIEKAREDLNWSRETLAEKLDVATTTVFRWETNKQGPSFEAVVNIAEALGKPLVHFIGESEEKVKTLPMSHSLKMALNIPDEVYEVAGKLKDTKHPVWEEIQEMLVAAFHESDITKNG